MGMNDMLLLSKRMDHLERTVRELQAQVDALKPIKLDYPFVHPVNVEIGSSGATTVRGATITTTATTKAAAKGKAK